VRLAEEAVGQRLDVALVDALARSGHSCTRSHLARAFAAGNVTSQGRVLKPGRVVEAALDVVVLLPEPEPLRADPEELPLVIVHEDDDLLVIDKAPTMVVHAGSGHHSGTLVNAVLGHLGVTADELPVLPGNERTRPGIVHRLDRETSGLIVVAKHARAQEHLALQFRTHDIERAYLGIVVGVPEWRRRRVETPHGRDPKDRRRFSPEVEQGRTAITNMEVEGALAGAALMRFRLETGRTHQIRMHARHEGHPILGDALYGRKIADLTLRAAAARLGRQALHAAILGFRHPRDGSNVRFESSLPDDLQQTLRELQPPG
jgi:23S rRNA pseudouridine1911/1915/1917 synthase